MSKLFFGKMNSLSETINKTYLTSDIGFLGDIQAGDYAIIKLEKESTPATVKRLWRLEKIEDNNGEISAIFDEICVFDPIKLLDFEALDLFVLNVNLLNKCNKQTKGLSFHNISLVDEDEFDNLVNNPSLFIEYLSDSNHYRKVTRVESKERVVPDSINVQFYKENDSWMFADADFIGEDLKSNYDSSQFDLFDKYGKKGSNTAKDKMYSFLTGMDVMVPMMGIWDLFCGTVKENVDTKKIKKKVKRREKFIEFCKNNGVNQAPKQYESSIRTMEKEMQEDIDAEYNKDKCQSLLNRVGDYVKSFDKSTVGNRINWNVYIKKYIEFKSIYPDENNSLSDSSLYTDSDSYEYSHAKHSGVNKVYYGTPGCGKSYYVENVVITQEEIDDSFVFRTTFFQDYTNTDFVGQILPKVNEGIVTYDFIPGPFTLALKCAIENPEDKVALVIEELNRGNAPSIFGDIFQLLDRKDGTSRYFIVNVNIQDYLKKESHYDIDYIRIPSNLFIYATMNTSDQNVFTLDTAFKRRWKYEKITNDFIGKDTIANKLVPGLDGITWKAFVVTVNKFIIDHATSLSAEDKQLGKYFVDEEMLMESMDDYSDVLLKDFAYKVFEYLWSDVAKFNRKDWFVDEVKSLDILIYKYMNHENIFSPLLAANLPVYVPEEEEA